MKSYLLVNSMSWDFVDQFLSRSLKVFKLNKLSERVVTNREKQIELFYCLRFFCMKAEDNQ